MMAAMSSQAAMGQQTQQTEEKKKTNWLSNITSRVQFNGYGQAGYAWRDANGKQTNDFNLKRTLLWAKANITDRWYFLFMHDFSSVVQEYYTDYRITKDKSLSVRLGQFKHSFSLENPMSPTQLELIDVYSMAVLYLAGEGPDPLFGVNYGRDLGLMIHGDLFKDHLHYELALMNGQGINRKDGNNKKDVIARLDIRPIDGLRIVLSGQKGTGHAVDTAAWNPDVKKGDDYRRDRISAGVEYKFGKYAAGKFKEARPVSLRAEALMGIDGDVVSRGGYLTVCVPLVEAIDFVACGDYYDRNKDVSGWKQANVTAGFQYWFYKKCRLQVQYSRCFCGSKISANDYNWLQAQVQVAF